MVVFEQERVRFLPLEEKKEGSLAVACTPHVKELLESCISR